LKDIEREPAGNAPWPKVEAAYRRRGLMTAWGAYPFLGQRVVQHLLERNVSVIGGAGRVFGPAIFDIDLKLAR
jgi:hypothetical protein